MWRICFGSSGMRRKASRRISHCSSRWPLPETPPQTHQIPHQQKQIIFTAVPGPTGLIDLPASCGAPVPSRLPKTLRARHRPPIKFSCFSDIIHSVIFGQTELQRSVPRRHPNILMRSHSQTHLKTTQLKRRATAVPKEHDIIHCSAPPPKK